MIQIKSAWLLTACLLAAASAPAGAGLWPQASVEDEKAESLCLLWIPREDPFDAAPLAKLLKENSDLRLSVALSAEAAAELSTSTLPPGRLEIAMRLKGDPVLPMISNLRSPEIAYGGTAAATEFSRPQDIMLRLALAQDAYTKLGLNPSGFVPAAGALSRETLRLFHRLQIRWLAIGGASSEPFRSQGLNLIPFQSYPPDESRPAAVQAYVFDEASDLAPPGFMLDFIRDRIKSGREIRWLTLSQRIAGEQFAEQAGEFSLIPWTRDYGTWIGGERKNGAWELLAKAAEDLEEYQNSGRATIKILDQAAQKLYQAESGRYFADAGKPEKQATEKEFRQILADIYGLLQKRIPAGLEDASENGEANAPGPSEGGTPAPFVESGETWLRFNDPAGEAFRPKAAEVSVSTQEISAHAAAAPNLWDIKTFEVSWDTRAIHMAFTMETTSPSAHAPFGFDDLLLDVYIDLNNRADSGIASLLPGRRFLMLSKDAWEYAVTISGWGAEVFRAGFQGEAIPLLALSPKWDMAKNRISVSIPRSLIRGAPRGWGYLAASMALNSTATDLIYFEPLDSETGLPLLDVLSPAGLPNPIKSYQRLPAIRVD
ncbi:MAG: hypothetical protein HY611_03795 [Elusimicrobia bacterium]|nr:hypothetical protein [Elusimicrobiota bacterium]